MQDLYTEIRATQTDLDRALAEYRARGQKYAECEHAYRVQQAQFITEQRAMGTAVTLLSDLAKGDQEIAKLRMMRDIALSLYESAKEAIQVYKLKIKILDGQIAREWGSQS
ncbi:MAG: hypothetical protein FWG40_00820 [Peptococcaceae bacterium]|nr:hypothetical protein [Peptococcaceae bacterium]